jgi:drug/metabolite transporter (DMT)-like permease
MLVIGSLLALLSGMFNAAAAALEKREGMRTGLGQRGWRLLAALARRPAWLLAIGLSALAWVGEAASLALAPVPVTATLRNAGRGLLVVGGARWLKERFTFPELVGVVLASAGGVITAISVVNSGVQRRLLSNVTQLLVGAGCMLVAAAVAALSRWLAGEGRHSRKGKVVSPGREKAAGLIMGAAVGVLFAGTGVFTKEIGDRFAVYGLGGLRPVLLSTGTWLMVVMAVWAQSLIQQAFRHANAASVSAVNACVASLGLIGAGFALYGESLPKGAGAVLLVSGIVISLGGAALLIASRPADQVGGAVEHQEGAVPQATAGGQVG